MDHRHVCSAAMVSNHDLLVAHEALEAGPSTMGLHLLLMRHLILEIANIADLAALSRSLYKEHPELGVRHGVLRKGFEFCKYLRNIYVGHFVAELSAKTFEWLPQANGAIGATDPDRQWIFSWFALETAINTYVEPRTGHKIFDSETDLNLPPDRARFLSFLGETALGASAFAGALIAATRGHFDVPNPKAAMLELALAASKTEFAHLTKGRR